MKCLSIVPLLILVANGLSPLRAETPVPPFVAPVFSDHMVLQRDQADPVWGWAKPGETVTVAIAGHTAKAVAGADGKWLAKLTPPPVGGPYELTVSGSQTVTFKDVLVGDVWLCSGQSNMDFGLGKAKNAAQEIASADHPQIRLFVVKTVAALHPLDRLEVKNTWAPCTPETVKRYGDWEGFSAVGYFFGRDLQSDLKVPVGLIQAAVGSTPGEAWTEGKALMKIGPDFIPDIKGLAQVDEAIKGGTYDRQKFMDQWFAQIGVTPDFSRTDFDASTWKTMRELPHKWGGRDDPALNNFTGAVWFRKAFDLPAAAAGRAADLDLGVLDDGDVTFVNGQKVGGEMNLSPRHYKIPAGVLKAGRNVVAIWLLNSFGPGGMSGKAGDYHLTVGNLAPVSLAGEWQYLVSTPYEQMPPRLFQAVGGAGWPSELFNGMVAPLAPFGIKGALWYQGEANVGHPYQYRWILEALISSWRRQWGQGDFPFLVVQLPNFGNGPGAKPGTDCDIAALRESQAEATNAQPAAGLVTTIDIGEAGNLHPVDKQDVGRRLALLARARVYGESIAYSGPVYKSCTRDGASLEITFDHTGGLHAKGDAKLKGFAIAGDDKVFHWADARIAGDKIVLTSPDVSKPVAARYDWGWSPDGNLYNAADLPAFPFRTDDWGRPLALKK